MSCIVTQVANIALMMAIISRLVFFNARSIPRVHFMRQDMVRMIYLFLCHDLTTSYR